MNPHKGDVALEIGAQTYTLRYSHSALVKLEQMTGKGLMKLMQEMGNPEEMRIGTLVALLCAGLQKHHPGMTFDDAADLLDEIEGGAAGAIGVIDEAFRKAFNAPGTKGTNPTLTGNGIGTESTSSTSASGTIRKSSGI